MSAAGRRGFDRIGDGDDAGELAVDGEEDRGGAVLAQTLGVVGERRGVDIELGEERGIAEREPFALDHADHAFAGRRVEAAQRCERNLALGCGSNDGRRQRMLAAALGAGGETQHLRLVEAGVRHDRDDFRLAFGERAGLVDNQRVDTFPCARALRRS